MKIRKAVVGLIAARDFQVKCAALQMVKYCKTVPREAAKFPLLYLEQTR